MTWRAGSIRRPLALVIALVAIMGGTRADEPRPAKAAAPARPSDAEAKAALADAVGQATDLVRAAVRAIRRGARRPAPVVEANPALVIDHYVAQFTPQFRSVLLTELHLVRTVCRPTPQELRAIKVVGEARLKSVVRQYAEVHKELRDADYRDDKQRAWPDVRQLILAALTESVRKTLSSEQVKRYEHNLQERAAARKRVARLCIVSKLDQELLLSAEQRDKLSDTLKSNWQEIWEQNLESWHYTSNSVPELPDEQVLPILSPTQREIWNGMRKRRVRNYGGTGFGFVQPLDENEDESAETEKPAEKVEAKTDQKE